MLPFELNAPEVNRVGLGCASLARDGVTDHQGIATIEAAWEHGIRYFDTAPMYGSGRSEYLLGTALNGLRREDYVISSKVGRLVDDPDPNGVGPSWQSWHFDFTSDGVKRSIEASMKRLRTDRIDLLLIHDPNDHWDTAISEAWPTLEDYRRQGVVRAVGAGMTQAPMLARFAEETTMDFFLVAGRYSLLDRSALDELFPICAEKGMRALPAQMLHGGLIDGVPNPQIYYRPVTEEIAERVDRIAAICRRHGVPMAAAAIQFPLAHPVVAGVITGPFSPDQVDQNLGWLAAEIPEGVWSDLKREGLLEADVPVPA